MAYEPGIDCEHCFKVALDTYMVIKEIVLFIAIERTKYYTVPNGIQTAGNIYMKNKDKHEIGINHTLDSKIL